MKPTGETNYEFQRIDCNLKGLIFYIEISVRISVTRLVCLGVSTQLECLDIVTVLNNITKIHTHIVLRTPVCLYINKNVKRET